MELTSQITSATDILLRTYLEGVDLYETVSLPSALRG